jgi:hypothetical protein
MADAAAISCNAMFGLQGFSHNAEKTRIQSVSIASTLDAYRQAAHAAAIGAGAP